MSDDPVEEAIATCLDRRLDERHQFSCDARYDPGASCSCWGPKKDETNPKDILGLKKPPLRLVPAALMLRVSRVMGLGAAKYGPYNWREKPVRLTVYLEAAQRHILASLDGEDVDPESGQPHEAHAAACMGIILDAMATGNLIDDRPVKGAAAQLIEELTEDVSE